MKKLGYFQDFSGKDFTQSKETLLVGPSSTSNDGIGVYAIEKINANKTLPFVFPGIKMDKLRYNNLNDLLLSFTNADKKPTFPEIKSLKYEFGIDVKCARYEVVNGFKVWYGLMFQKTFNTDVINWDIIYDNFIKLSLEYTEGFYVWNVYSFSGEPLYDEKELSNVALSLKEYTKSFVNIITRKVQKAANVKYVDVGSAVIYQSISNIYPGDELIIDFNNKEANKYKGTSNMFERSYATYEKWKYLNEQVIKEINSNREEAELHEREEERLKQIQLRRERYEANMLDKKLKEKEQELKERKKRQLLRKEEKDPEEEEEYKQLFGGLKMSSLLKKRAIQREKPLRVGDLVDVDLSNLEKFKKFLNSRFNGKIIRLNNDNTATVFLDLKNKSYKFDLSRIALRRKVDLNKNWDPGDSVEILERNDGYDGWWKATIIEKQGNDYLISWDAYYIDENGKLLSSEKLVPPSVIRSATVK